MKILSIECSAVPCSAAITENGRIIGSSFVNVKLTHSQTLMPLVENLLKTSMTNLSEIEGFAVSAGPGSFTGIRIGISAIKGLAAAKKIPCAGVSTLSAMAENFSDTDCIVCAVMDARCNQVYNALFDIQNGCIERLCEDRALMCDQLASELNKIAEQKGKNIIIVGDGADIFYPFVENKLPVSKADIKRRYQNATGVALAAEKLFENGQAVSPNELLPVYLRLPQAERELKEKQK